MRLMKMPPFEYACPTTLGEAVALLASKDGDAKALAGGQSLVPMLAFRLAQPTLLVDLRKLSELREIKISASGVTLGAMVRWRDSEDDERLASEHPLFYDEDDPGKARHAHVGVIGVADRPLRLPAVEAVINGRRIDDATIAEAEAATCAAVDPPSDIHASAAYRRALVGTMVERALKM